MSGSIYIQPRTKGEKTVYTSTPSNWRDTFEEVFGSLPYELKKDDWIVLNAMAILSEKQNWANKDAGNPWRELADGVSKLDDYDYLTVRMEY